MAWSAEPSKKLEFSDAGELKKILVEADYTHEAWDNGLPPVPRYYIAWIPERWAAKTVKEITVEQKKNIFFRLVAPLVLQSNETILDERSRLQKLGQQKAAGKTLAKDDEAWLAALAEHYDVPVPDSGSLSAIDIKHLERRIDIVPVSLALAQAADESGWGTARFAVEGNAFYGQWTYKKSGLKPKSQRKSKGDYRVAAFPTPLASVEAYMLDLNSGRAYAGFRKKRGELRAANQIISGVILAGTLDRYSERGKAYIKDILGLIRYNKLGAKDHLQLKKMEPVSLVPAGPGAKP